MSLQRIASPFSGGSPVDPATVRPEIIPIRDLANDFVHLAVLLYSIGSNRLDLQRSIDRGYFHVKFDPTDDTLILTPKKSGEESIIIRDFESFEASAIQQSYDILKRDTLEFYEVRAQTEARLLDFPQHILEQLSALKKAPWIALVLRESILTIAHWPIEIPSLNNWAGGCSPEPRPYIPTEVAKLLKHCSEADPTGHWKKAYDSLMDFKLDLEAISPVFGVTQPDGLVGPGVWRQYGREIIGPKQKLTQRFVEVLWKASPSKVSFDELAESVWGDGVTKLDSKVVGKERTSLHGFFREYSIPWHVEVLSATRQAVLLPGPPPATK